MPAACPGREMILVIKHIDIEGPGTLGDFFTAGGMGILHADVYAGARLPRDLAGISAVVCLGGPMNVYEDKKYPFLLEEERILREAVEQGLPVMGICLGAQLLAKSCGAKVSKSPVREIGWRRVTLTDEGRRDRLFAGIPGRPEVFEWHEDTFGVPEGGVLLARGEDCRNQAFRVGKNAYGLQFHVEVTGGMISDWIKRYAGGGGDALRREAAEIQLGKNSDFHRTAQKIYANFSGIMKD